MTQSLWLSFLSLCQCGVIQRDKHSHVIGCWCSVTFTRVFHSLYNISGPLIHNSNAQGRVIVHYHATEWLYSASFDTQYGTQERNPHKYFIKMHFCIQKNKVLPGTRSVNCRRQTRDSLSKSVTVIGPQFHQHVTTSEIPHWLSLFWI